MVNCMTLTQLEHVLEHMKVVLCSKFVTPAAQKSYDYLRVQFKVSPTNTVMHVQRNGTLMYAKTLA